VTHPTRGLDDVVHQRHRLGILTVAAEARRVDRCDRLASAGYYQAVAALAADACGARFD